jgi:polyisoprenyl-phosphate glycosyltransferase
VLLVIDGPHSNDEPGMTTVRVPFISVVAPCFNEQQVLSEFLSRVRQVCETVSSHGYEIVLVDDGSQDATWAVICEQAQSHAEIVGVRLSRNFGHQAAVTAGVSVARGEFILLIDADLQDPPELLTDFLNEMNRTEADVVYGKRISRAGETRFKTATAAIFYRFLTKISDTPIPLDTGDFRLMKAWVARAFLSMPEQQRFVRGMISWIGGRQVAIPYARQSRHAGETAYSLTRMVFLALDAITSFSIVPLRLATWLGVFAIAVAAVLFLFTVFAWLAGATVIGWSSLMTSIVWFSGVQLLVLGVIGEYLGRVFSEAKRRPPFYIQAMVSGKVGERDAIRRPPDSPFGGW